MDNESFLMNVIDKIHSFKSLSEGWHYGEGVPPHQKTVDIAVELATFSENMGFTNTDAFPGINGEIMFTVYHDKHYLEFSIEPNGDIAFTYEYDDNEIGHMDGISLEYAKDAIQLFKEMLGRKLDTATPAERS